MRPFADAQTYGEVLLPSTRIAPRGLLPKLDGTVRAVIQLWYSDFGEWESRSEEEVDKGGDVRFLAALRQSSAELLVLAYVK